MSYYAFNIGKPYLDTWWRFNRDLKIITTGYEGKPGDRGEILLQQMNEGDWVLAYANRHGFVGAGKVGPKSTYKLLPRMGLPAEWPSNHRHCREVNWIYAVDSLSDAIPASKVDRQAPRQTKERLSAEVGAHLIALLLEGTPRVSAAQVARCFAENVELALLDSSETRKIRLRKAPKFPQKAPVLTYEFVRNSDVVAETLYQAKGVCGRCKSNAPFKRRIDQSPYLEVHHKTPLADGGEDTLDNAIALCPNCHRELHYGSDIPNA